MQARVSASHHCGSVRSFRRYFGRLVAAFGTPRVVITGKLRSYSKPIRAIAPDANHRAHKGLTFGSKDHTGRRGEMFGQSQRFLGAHDQIRIVFRPRRYRLSAISYRHARAEAFDLWGGYAAGKAP